MKNKKIKYFSLIIALTLIMQGYIVKNYFPSNEAKTYEIIQKSISEIAQENEEKLKKIALNEIENSILITTYKNKVINWNNNEVIIDEIIHQDPGLIKTKNGWLIMSKKCQNDSCKYILTKIKQEYIIENNYLTNYFHPKLKLNKEVEIVSAKENDEHYFVVSNKKFKLIKYDDNKSNSSINLNLEILGLIMLLLSMILISKDLKSETLIIISILLIRFLLLSDYSLSFLKETEIFNPNIFAWDKYTSSIADLILHFISLNLLAIAVQNKIIKSLIFGITAALLLNCSHLLVIHSDLQLNFENILDISLFGWLIVILFTIEILLISNYLAKNKNQSEILLFCLIIIIFESVNLRYHTTIIVVFSIIVSHYLIKNTPIKNSLLILTFAFVINQNISLETNEKNKQKIINSLEKKSEKRNIITEYQITDFLNDLTIQKNYINLISKKTIKEKINKLPGEFEFNIGECFDPNACLNEDLNTEIIEENSKFKLFYNLASEKEYYTAIFKSKNKNIWLTIKENKKDENYGFPILLANPKMQNYYFKSNSSIAKYINNILVYSDGKHNFPKQFKPNKNYITFNVKNQKLVYIDLEKKESNWLYGVSYLFIFCLTLNYLYALAFNNNYVINFRFKIQFSIIVLIIFSVAIIAIGSIYTQQKQQKQNLQKNLLNNVAIIANTIENKIGVINSLNDLQAEYIQKLIENLGNNYSSDINLYKPNGYLLNSTRDKIYDDGILSHYIHPIPFKKIKLKRIKSFVQTEKIGEKLNYFSAYHGVYNDQKKLIGIIQIPYFMQTKDFNEDINQYILSIINIYILLIIIALITGYIIAKKITKPLEILAKNLQNLQLSNLNQKLKWETNDEIGQLIQQYNLTLEKLETNVQKLAQKERESAWREMAQQVAHEIKNPLTPMKLSMQHFLMRWDDLDEETKNKKFKDVAKNMIEQMDQLAEIASDFSSFAKINEGLKENIHLDDVLKNVITVFNTDNIIDYTPSKKTLLNGNKNELNRVFTNLIQNAIQAVEANKKPKIEISKKVLDNFIEIKIKDNGKGIPPEIQDKIFTPKFTTKNSGSGLGLAMVKQIIDFHEGKIYFESSNSGTTFTILLPKL